MAGPCRFCFRMTKSGYFSKKMNLCPHQKESQVMQGLTLSHLTWSWYQNETVALFSEMLPFFTNGRVVAGSIDNGKCFVEQLSETENGIIER